jgi:hypothetical protein
LWKNPTQTAAAQQAAFAQYASLAITATALVNDTFTLLPDVVLKLSSQELAVVALCAACRHLEFHLVPFHSDSYGMWRHFWPGVTRSSLEEQAKKIIDTIQSPPSVPPLSSTAEQEARNKPEDTAIDRVEKLDQLAGDEMGPDDDDRKKQEEKEEAPHDEPQEDKDEQP